MIEINRILCPLVHGRNVFDLAFFGSNSKDVIRQAHCPVLIVPAPRRAAMRAAS